MFQFVYNTLSGLFEISEQKPIIKVMFQFVYNTLSGLFGSPQSQNNSRTQRVNNWLQEDANQKSHIMEQQASHHQQEQFQNQNQQQQLKIGEYNDTVIKNLRDDQINQSQLNEKRQVGLYNNDIDEPQLKTPQEQVNNNVYIQNRADAAKYLFGNAYDSASQKTQETNNIQMNSKPNLIYNQVNQENGVTSTQDQGNDSLKHRQQNGLQNQQPLQHSALNEISENKDDRVKQLFGNGLAQYHSESDSEDSKIKQNESQITLEEPTRKSLLDKRLSTKEKQPSFSCIKVPSKESSPKKGVHFSENQNIIKEFTDTPRKSLQFQEQEQDLEDGSSLDSDEIDQNDQEQDDQSSDDLDSEDESSEDIEAAKNEKDNNNLLGYFGSFFSNNKYKNKSQSTKRQKDAINGVQKPQGTKFIKSKFYPNKLSTEIQPYTSNPQNNFNTHTISEPKDHLFNLEQIQDNQHQQTQMFMDQSLEDLRLTNNRVSNDIQQGNLNLEQFQTSNQPYIESNNEQIALVKDTQTPDQQYQQPQSIPSTQVLITQMSNLKNNPWQTQNSKTDDVKRNLDYQLNKIQTQDASKMDLAVQSDQRQSSQSPKKRLQDNYVVQNQVKEDFLIPQSPEKKYKRSESQQENLGLDLKSYMEMQSKELPEASQLVQNKQSRIGNEQQNQKDQSKLLSQHQPEINNSQSNGMLNDSSYNQAKTKPESKSTQNITNYQKGESPNLHQQQQQEKLKSQVPGKQLKHQQQNEQQQRSEALNSQQQQQLTLPYTLPGAIIPRQLTQTNKLEAEDQLKDNIMQIDQQQIPFQNSEIQRKRSSESRAQSNGLAQDLQIIESPEKKQKVATEFQNNAWDLDKQMEELNLYNDTLMKATDYYKYQNQRFEQSRIEQLNRQSQRKSYYTPKNTFGSQSRQAANNIISNQFPKLTQEKTINSKANDILDLTQDHRIKSTPNSINEVLDLSKNSDAKEIQSLGPSSIKEINQNPQLTSLIDLSKEESIPASDIDIQNIQSKINFDNKLYEPLQNVSSVWRYKHNLPTQTRQSEKSNYQNQIDSNHDNRTQDSNFGSTNLISSIDQQSNQDLKQKQYSMQDNSIKQNQLNDIFRRDSDYYIPQNSLAHKFKQPMTQNDQLNQRDKNDQQQNQSDNIFRTLYDDLLNTTSTIMPNSKATQNPFNNEYKSDMGPPPYPTNKKSTISEIYKDNVKMQNSLQNESSKNNSILGMQQQRAQQSQDNLQRQTQLTNKLVGEARNSSLGLLDMIKNGYKPKVSDILDFKRADRVVARGSSFASIQSEHYRKLDQKKEQKLRQVEKSLRSLRESGKYSLIPEKPTIPTPTEQDRKIFREALYGTVYDRDPNKVLVNHKASSLTLTRHMLQCMDNQGWLNDEVINMYIRLLVDRDLRYRSQQSQQNAQGPGGYDYGGVRKWTTENRISANLKQKAYKTILENDKVIVPIHIHGNHWVTGIINLEKKQLEYYDSLQGKSSQYVDYLSRYLQDEANNKLNQSWDVQSWPRILNLNTPQQTNGSDCGVFMLNIMKYSSMNQQLSFSQADMQNLRILMVVELMKQHIE